MGSRAAEPEAVTIAEEETPYCPRRGMASSDWTMCSPPSSRGEAEVRRHVVSLQRVGRLAPPRNCFILPRTCSFSA